VPILKETVMVKRAIGPEGGAVEILEVWLKANGFEVNGDMAGFPHYTDGYFAESLGNLREGDWQTEYTHGVIGYRGGGQEGVRRHLQAVARRLDELGVKWEARENSWGYWMLVVPVAGLSVEPKQLPAG
jgi:hypothetical protein